MKWRLKLLVSTSILLTACQEDPSPASSFSTNLTVLPVEYYSRSTVTNVPVTLTDENGQTIEKRSVDGEVIFENLQEDGFYTIQIGTGEAQTTHELLFDPASATTVVETKAIGHAQALAVPVVKQLPQLPHGCEITSLTAVFQYYGEQVDKMEMVKHLPREAFSTVNGQKVGPDPHLAYAGNPASQNGTYSFAQPIVVAAENYLATSILPMEAKNVSGSTVAEIERLVEQGVPVVSWVTLDLSPPQTKEGWLIKNTNKQHNMFTNLHAVVIVDVTEDYVEVMDPLKGVVQHPKQTFFNSYQSLGQQAMIVY